MLGLYTVVFSFRVALKLVLRSGEVLFALIAFDVVDLVCCFVLLPGLGA